MTAHYPVSWWTAEERSPPCDTHTRPRTHTRARDQESGQRHRRPCVTVPERIPFGHSYYKTIKRAIFAATAGHVCPAARFSEKLPPTRKSHHFPLYSEAAFRAAIGSSFVFMRGIGKKIRNGKKLLRERVDVQMLRALAIFYFSFNRAVDHPPFMPRGGFMPRR